MLRASARRSTRAYPGMLRPPQTLGEVDSRASAGLGAVSSSNLFIHHDGKKTQDGCACLIIKMTEP
jgi:hypothetical protein